MSFHCGLACRGIDISVPEGPGIVPSPPTKALTRAIGDDHLTLPGCLSVVYPTNAAMTESFLQGHDTTRNDLSYLTYILTTARRRGMDDWELNSS